MNELGQLRPSQLIFTFGIGSLVDLPNMSALVMGLDDWEPRTVGTALLPPELATFLEKDRHYLRNKHLIPMVRWMV